MSSFKFILNRLNESNIPDYFKSDKEFRQHWIDLGVDNSVTELSTCIRPYDIEIKKEARGKGLGTEFMKDLCKFADYLELPIRINPSASLGATSVGRLITFYKRFGFVENKGKKFRPEVIEKMYREHK